MILETTIKNLQHENSQGHKHLLPNSNPAFLPGLSTLHHQSLSLLPCLSNPFMAGADIIENPMGSR